MNSIKKLWDFKSQPIDISTWRSMCARDEALEERDSKANNYFMYRYL